MHRSKKIRWRLLSAVVVLGVLPALAATPSAAAGLLPSPPPTFQHELLAKAAPDECFDGIGMPYPAGPPCAQGQAKVNQAYVWSLARANNRLWFGTGANVNCIVGGTTLSRPNPRLNDDYVCEFAESQIVKQNPTMPTNVGDHRHPRAYVYDESSRVLTEKTDDVKNASTDDASRLRRTLGLRAGATHQGVVLLAGPALGQSVNMFAFDTVTGQYLGSANFAKYGNIRNFVIADNVLYAGVGVGANGREGGYVLRWAGDRTNPFAFVEVGQLAAQVADLAVHEGRIFVSTWSAAGGGTLAAGSTTSGSGLIGNLTGSLLGLIGIKPVEEADPGVAGVWMSPPLTDGDPGLTANDTGRWKLVWSASSYEPDPIIAGTYGLGALMSYDGYLYWGTMHVPMKSTSKIAEAYPPGDEVEARAVLEKSQRAVSIFRGKRFGTLFEDVDLLYGEEKLPAYDATANNGAGAWTNVSTGHHPLHGRIGFGNIYTNYTWTMEVAGGRLFIGTMDWSYLAKDLIPETAAQMGFRGAATGLSSELDPIVIDPQLYGGDLWMYESSLKPATAVDTRGLGNHLNYGFRTMVPVGSTLYLGTGNPMNLRTDPTDDVPEGGWELIRLVPVTG
ncbi:hypothetical protein [Micromonospora sagamiensis]|uniref:Uncharacterized protein n=2 Tax=Micromonospora sagamiensis TaxID=47875 RepID=A0A562W8M0_9ACTN|nr:hypothetical protein [Micromonospora sagamiensis]TWJ26552.1 hypothetical protein JD81_00007 [Micromonospora sagamiensis]BCL14563.1 hypothetical protein GCM10017556_23020 [Micromonospora sagamiensis]